MNWRNFLSPLLLNTGKEQEHGGTAGIATLRIREFPGLGSSAPIDML
jgi:hypothetical protein